MKPITTRYKGYRFRSRLEARWAVFFDALGVAWEYEKEGFDLEDGVKYLPDFWMPTAGYLEYKSPIRNNESIRGLWIEIKPGPADLLEVEKMTRLVVQSKKYGLIVQGNPWPEQHSVLMIQNRTLGPTLQTPNCYFRSGEWSDGKTTLDVSHHTDGISFPPSWQLANGKTSDQAFIAARHARFEHGESGRAA